MLVEDAEAAVQQEQGKMRKDDNVGLTNRPPEKSFHEMLVPIGDCVSDLPCSDDGENGADDNDEETEQGKLSEDEKPGWVMGRISQTVQQRMERFQQNQMKLEKLTQPGWEDAADNFCERNKMYGKSDLRVLAVVKPQMDDDAAAPATTTFGELMEWIDIVPGIWQM